MDELEIRLKRSFALVFPDLPEIGIRGATLTSVPGWDSMATVILIKVIEEEFGVSVDADDVEYITSFGSVLHYLKEKAVATS